MTMSLALLSAVSSGPCPGLAEVVSYNPAAVSVFQGKPWDGQISPLQPMEGRVQLMQAWICPCP